MIVSSRGAFNCHNGNKASRAWTARAYRATCSETIARALGIGPFLLSPVIAIEGVTGAFHGAAALIMISLVLFFIVYGDSGAAHVQGNRADTPRER